MHRKIIGLVMLCMAMVTACNPVINSHAGRQPATATPTPVDPYDTEMIPAEYRGKLKLFALMGQSNMSGRGEVPEELRHSNHRVFMFANDYRWKPAEEPVDSPEGQVDLVSEDMGAGISPSLSFAETLLGSKPDWVIGLIPCAKDSTSMVDWAQNDDPKSLYGSCLKRILLAAEMGTVEGILFYQGETDASDPNYYLSMKINRSILPADEWADAFGDFVRAWRSDLGIPDLPVVFAQLAINNAPESFPNWEVIKEQQAAVDLANVRMIKTDDLELGDPVHLSPESYLEVGRRFAEGYLQIIK